MALKRKGLVSESAVELFRQSILSTPGFQPHLRQDEPDWSAFVKPLGLAGDRQSALVAALRRLWILPFADIPACADLLIFEHVRLPTYLERFRASADQKGMRLVTLFGLFTRMFLQGNSAFPQNPTHLARLTQQAIELGLHGDRRLDAMLDLLVEDGSARPRAGYNNFDLQDPDLVIRSEHERREGITEGAWKSKHKFEGYRRQVISNPEFHKDWKLLQQHFDVDRFRDSRSILRRSKLPERNWQPPTFPDLDRVAERFQVAFDFFCWKWFLYGMRGDEPLVEKLSHTFTPYGTQIFIPGYWSLDVTRDLEWGTILRLHRARGVARQGEKFSQGRRQKAALLSNLLAANDAATAHRLKGKPRYDLLKKAAGLVADTDDAQVRRMLRQAKAMKSQQG